MTKPMEAITGRATTIGITTVPDAFGLMERLPCYKYWTAERGDWIAPSSSGDAMRHLGTSSDVMYHEGMKALILLPKMVKQDMDVTAMTAHLSNWKDCAPVGEQATYLKHRMADLRGSFIESTAATFPENACLWVKIIRPPDMPLFTAWAPSTGYSTGDIVCPTAGVGFVQTYQATKDGTSGTVEPTWPKNDQGVWTEDAPATAAWREQTEDWEFLWGLGAHSGTYTGYSIRFNRFGVVTVNALGINASTHVFTRTELAKVELRDEERVRFRSEQQINFGIFPFHGRLFVRCSAFNKELEAKLPSPATTISAGRYGFRATSGCYAWNVSPYKFPESGTVDTISMEHFRSFTSDGDTYDRIASYPTPSATLNGSVTAAIKAGGTYPGSERAYTLTIARPVTGTYPEYYTPVVQAVCIEYDPDMIANGSTPTQPNWSRALSTTFADASDYHVNVTVQFPEHAYEGKATVTLELTDKETDWEAFLAALFVDTPKEGSLLFKELAVQIKMGYYNTAKPAVASRITHLTGLARAFSEQFDVKGPHRLTLEVFDQWTRYRIPGLNTPPLFGLTWAAALQKLAIYCGKRTAEIALDSAITGADHTITDPGWGYNDPPTLGMLQPGVMVSEAMSEILTKFAHKGRAEHDGLGVFRCAVMPQVRSYGAGVAINWHDWVVRSGRTYVALTSGLTGGSPPTWTTTGGELIVDNQVIWILQPTIPWTSVNIGDTTNGEDVATGSTSFDNTGMSTGMFASLNDPDGVPITSYQHVDTDFDSPTASIAMVSPSEAIQRDAQTQKRAATEAELDKYLEGEWKDRTQSLLEVSFTNPIRSYWMWRPGLRFILSDERVTPADTADMEAISVTLDDKGYLNQSSIVGREVVA